MEASKRQAHWERRANYCKSAIRAIGGHLRVVHDTLVFNPHAAEKVTFAKDWAVQLADIEAVEVEPRNLKHISAGGLRKRLAIVVGDGRRALFVVDDLDHVVDELRGLSGLDDHS